MTPLFTIQTIGIVTILLSAFLAAAPIRAQDREPATVAPESNAMTEEDIAAGSAEDTMGACLARIPRDASIGQVMIAEQSCWRDENERKPVQAIPGARSTSLMSPASG
jgi:hypothetical protein